MSLQHLVVNLAESLLINSIIFTEIDRLVSPDTQQEVSLRKESYSHCYGPLQQIRWFKNEQHSLR